MGVRVFVITVEGETSKSYRDYEMCLTPMHSEHSLTFYELNLVSQDMRLESLP